MDKEDLRAGLSRPSDIGPSPPEGNKLTQTREREEEKVLSVGSGGPVARVWTVIPFKTC